MALTVAFICGFEFGPGPIVWLYQSEICNNSATSVNTVVNWMWTLNASIVVLPLFTALEGYLWLLYAILSTFGLFYMMKYMKETRGVSKDKLKSLYYRPDKTE